MVIEAYLKNERGMALVVALMLLVLLTVMGLAAISTTSTELQLTSNERTDARAFHSAEAGIKEALYRTTLAGLGATSLANGGSTATVDGVSFNATIADPLVGGNINPDWEYRIYFSSTDPADSGSVIYSRTLLSKNNKDWDALNYGGDVGNEAQKPPVVVRYLKESDLVAWGIFPHDMNNDGDDKDLVYFNGSNTNPQRLGAGTAINGQVDFAPPANINRNLVIRLITATGRSDKATKGIQLETTGFPVNPNVNAAVQAGHQVTMSGSGFISGYNHSENTQNNNTDKNNINANLYNNDHCDNFSGGSNLGANSGKCGLGGNDPDIGYTAEYSGLALSSGHKPAILTSDAVNSQGNAVEAWGGDDQHTVGWKKYDPALTFPDLPTMLGVDQAAVDGMLANANKSTSVCPSSGVTYIDNKNGGVYMPTTIPNCPAGSGILIVTGDVKIPSNFEFRGLIYVEGDAELRGGTWVLGAMAVKGQASGVTLNNGNPTILYSYNTVVNAVTAAMNQAGSRTILSWRED